MVSFRLLTKIPHKLVVVTVTAFTVALYGYNNLLTVDYRVHRTLGGDLCTNDAPSQRDRLKRKRAYESRSLSISLGEGQCEFKDAKDIEHVEGEPRPWGIVIASFPASGMRVTWQHVEGLTGIQVADDFDCEPQENPNAPTKIGIVKTQYPHLEGIWSWGNNMDEVVLLVRNPRWAIPSYHTLLHEIDYAHDCETAYEMLHAIFTYRPPVWKWIRWRDLRFEEEIKLWSWHIDYYMGNGRQYWMNWDFERNGQSPFSWIPEEERFQDVNCIYQNLNCVPQTIVAYEKILDPETGPQEINKVAKVFENKRGLTVIDDQARECVYHATIDSHKLPSNGNRAGDAADYNFTYKQMGIMRDEIVRMKLKYSASEWIGNKNAADLVEYFQMYITSIEDEMSVMANTQYPPTPAPNAEYHQSLMDWYKSIGRGDRYNKARVQAMVGLWPKIKHLYDDDDYAGEIPEEV